MTTNIKKLIAGNWKMNGLLQDSHERLAKLASLVASLDKSKFDMVVCPPAVLIPEAKKLLADSTIKVGGQDCHEQKSGAFTGNIAADMLKDAGCDYVILGHSERRQYQKETDELIALKAKAAHAAGLIAIICVGELGSDRDSGKQNEIVGAQLKKAIPETATSANTVVAYEPVWAIGTGKTASNDDIKAMHDFIRAELKGKVEGSEKTQILYGGSVKGSNANEILHISNVDGVLVGGASLKADEFADIAKAS